MVEKSFSASEFTRDVEELDREEFTSFGRAKQVGIEVDTVLDGMM